MGSWTTERLSETGIREVAVEVYDGEEHGQVVWLLAEHGGQLPTDEELKALYDEACRQLAVAPSIYSIKVKGEEEQFPAACTAPTDDLDLTQAKLNEACDLYERIAPFIGKRIEDLNLQPDDEQEKADTWALVDQAADFALECLKKRIPFSLVGYSLREDGDGVTHHITASDDSEMIDKATKALALAPTIGFALIGEGTVYDADGKATSALFCYCQHRSMEGPAQLFKPYRKSFLGLKLEEGDWRFVRQLEGSWL